MDSKFILGIIAVHMLSQRCLCAPYDTKLSAFELFKSLDINSMSRLLAYKNRFMKPERNRRPKLTEPWNYRKINGTWPQRLGLYGYGIADIVARGDGSCFFNALNIILRTGGMTKEKIKKGLDPNMSPGIYHGIMAISDESPFFEPIELKRISIITFFGCDPDSQESYAHYDHDHLLREVGNIGGSELYTDPKNRTVMEIDGVKIAEGWDVVSTLKELKEGKNQRKIALDLFRKLEEHLPDRWGDYIDLGLLERSLGFKALLFNDASTQINCGLFDHYVNPNFFITMYYFPPCHFDVAGLFSLEEAAPVTPKSLFLLDEIPTGLAIIMIDDCRLQRT